MNTPDERLICTLSDEDYLAERLLHGLAVHTRGKFELDPQPRWPRANVGGKPRGKTQKLFVAYPELRELGLMLHNFVEGADRSVKAAGAMSLEVENRLSRVHAVFGLEMALLGYKGPAHGDQVAELLRECELALSLEVYV